MDQASLSGHRRDWLRRWGPAVVVVALGVIAYLSSFGGIFLYDDLQQIVNNQRLLTWSPAGSRPIVDLSFAVNHAIGGFDPWGYHLVNLVIHLGAALTLLSLVRRTMSLETVPAWVRAHASRLSLVVAVLWTVHPLQTESVTYVVQRAESLMGLCYLLTLLCLLRAVTTTSAGRRRWFYSGAVAACVVGMGAKPVIVTAPLVAALFDRAFLSASWREIVARRWGFYAALVGTWVIVAGTGTLADLFMNDASPTRTAGLGIQHSTPLTYLFTQSGVILHYLRLVIWPSPLCLAYGWPTATGFSTVAVPLLLVGALFGASVRAWVRRPAVGFLGLSFFFVLAPTSSVVPFAHPIFEHRMYLPLASVLILMVIGGLDLALRARRRWPAMPAARLNRLVGLSMIVVTVALVATTRTRNGDYHSELRMWGQAVEARPDSDTAWGEYARVIADDTPHADLAVEAFLEAIRLGPNNCLHRINLAVHYTDLGDFESAHRMAGSAVAMCVHESKGYRTLGTALIGMGRLEEGIESLQEAVRLDPSSKWNHINLARGLALRAGTGGNGPVEAAGLSEALDHAVEAIRIDPELQLAVNYLAILLRDTGDIDGEAARRRVSVLAGESRFLAWMGTARAAMNSGRHDDARRAFDHAATIKPDDPRLPQWQTLLQQAEASSATN